MKGQPQSIPSRREENRNQPQQPQSTSNPERGESTSGNGNAGDANDGNQMFSSNEIAERAYQIFEREGRNDGRDMEHWLQAERELRMEREQRTGGMNPQNAQNAPRSARQHQR